MRLTALLVIFLTGCASVPEKTVEVSIPIPVYTPCPITPVPKPVMCVPKNDTRPEVLRCWLVEREQNKTYIRELETQLAICSE